MKHYFRDGEMRMSENLKQWLQALALLFAEHSFTLYGVGGMVRNPLLGFEISDIDVCSCATVEQVDQMLGKYKEYTTVPKGAAFGTVEIHGTFGGESFLCEHTTFRKETYGQTGQHRPLGVVFSDNLAEDAFRRDFSINALYQNLLTEEIIDPTGGLADLKNRVMRTTNLDPDLIMRDDGLRTLRLVRFACELGFSIDEKTFTATKKNAALLQDIPAERVWREIRKILLSDSRYPAAAQYSPDDEPAHYRGLSILVDLGLMQYVFPELLEGQNLTQSPIYHQYTVLKHNMHSCAMSRCDLIDRLAALLHDVGKPRVWYETGKMLRHDQVGMHLARIMLERLKAPRTVTKMVCQLVRWHMLDLDGNAKEKTLRKHFLLLGEETSERLAYLREADFLGSGIQKPPILTAVRFLQILNKMKDTKVPFSMKQVEITGQEIMQSNCLKPSPVIGWVKHKLWLHCALYPRDNHRQRLIALSEQILKQYPNIEQQLKKDVSENKQKENL